jgi:hypothetical protein
MKYVPKKVIYTNMAFEYSNSKMIEICGSKIPFKLVRKPHMKNTALRSKNPVLESECLDVIH